MSVNSKKIKNNGELITYNNLIDNKCDFNLDYKKNKKSNKKKKIKIPLISVEEAFDWPNQINEMAGNKNPVEVYTIAKQLSDIGEDRIKGMDESNITVQILSATAPGIQNLKNEKININDKKTYVINKCKEVNDYTYRKINLNNKSKQRLKAFAALPMFSAIESAKELERCVKELGFVGALINGYDDSLAIEPNYYTSEEYDVLWQKFVELDVPLYIHPRVATSVGSDMIDQGFKELFKEYPELVASTWNFHISTAELVLKLFLSGLFRRNPDFKLILGHAGEILSFWSERFDHRICMTSRDYFMSQDKIVKQKYEIIGKEWPKFDNQLTLNSLFKKNIYISVSGFTSTPVLKFLLDKFGPDRILFAVDYPYENQLLASNWFLDLDLNMSIKKKIGYQNSEKLFKFKIPKSLY